LLGNLVLANASSSSVGCRGYRAQDAVAARIRQEDR
jgi:hypothetical protein